MNTSFVGTVFDFRFLDALALSLVLIGSTIASVAAVTRLRTIRRDIAWYPSPASLTWSGQDAALAATGPMPP